MPKNLEGVVKQDERIFSCIFFILLHHTISVLFLFNEKKFKKYNIFLKITNYVACLMEFNQATPTKNINIYRFFFLMHLLNKIT